MSPCVGFNTEAQRSQRRTELSPNCDRSGAGLRPTFGYEEIRIRETSGTRDSSHGSGSLHTQHRASAVPDLQSFAAVVPAIRMCACVSAPPGWAGTDQPKNGEDVKTSTPGTA